MVDPSKTYHGRPCKNCGGTLKLRRNWMCVACERIRQRDFKRRIREDFVTYNSTLLANRRRSALKRMAERG